jgi:hypothetical protein
MIINTSGLNKNYTEFIDPDGDGPLPEEEQVIPPEDYFDFLINLLFLQKLSILVIDNILLSFFLILKSSIFCNR